MMVGQLKHMQTADLGFNKDNVLIIPARGNSNKHYNVIKSELVSHPEIVEVTSGSEIPDNINFGEIEWGTREMLNENQAIARIMRVGYDFDKTFDLQLEEGRFFSRDHATDSTHAVVVNRETAKIMGYEDPVGKPFYLYNDEKEYTIIGVVSDFQFFPLIF